MEYFSTKHFSPFLFILILKSARWENTQYLYKYLNKRSPNQLPRNISVEILTHVKVPERNITQTKSLLALEL